AVDQRPALLDVHLEEAAHALELLAARRQRVAGDAVDRGRIAHHLEHMVDVQAAGDGEAGERGRAGPRTLLGDERHGPAPGAPGWRGGAPASSSAAAASSAATTPSAPS